MKRCSFRAIANKIKCKRKAEIFLLGIMKALHEVEQIREKKKDYQFCEDKPND